METGRIFFCRSIPFSFLGQHMHQHCMVHSPGFPERFHHGFDIVPVHRSQVSHAHVLKEHSRNDQLLDAVFGAADLLYQAGTNHWNF